MARDRLANRQGLGRQVGVVDSVGIRHPYSLSPSGPYQLEPS